MSNKTRIIYLIDWVIVAIILVVAATEWMDCGFTTICGVALAGAFDRILDLTGGYDIYSRVNHFKNIG